MEDTINQLEGDESLSLNIPSISSQTSFNTFVLSTSSTESRSESLYSPKEESEHPSEKLETVLNILNEHILAYCDNSLSLQRKRDFLLLSMNLVKNNDLLKELPATDRRDIKCYIQSISKRLNSVEISISHTRKLESTNRIDELINTMICSGDIIQSHNQCERYLNAFENLLKKKSEKRSVCDFEKRNDQIDMEFRALLLGCKKIDRENVKNRLASIMDHLSYQMYNELNLNNGSK